MSEYFECMWRIPQCPFRHIKCLEQINSEEYTKILVDEIIAKKKASKVRSKSIPELVNEFSSLNYLLDDLVNEIKPVKEKEELKDSKVSCPPLDSEGNRRIDGEGVELLDNCIQNDQSTKDLHTDENGVYTPKRLKVHNKILKTWNKSITCVNREKPVAIFMGGSPASGKSTFLKNFAPYMTSDKIYRIDADAVRDMLPEYKGWNANSTHQETKDIVNKLIDKIATPCIHDVVFDGTMSSPKNYLKIIDRIKGFGYKTFIILMKIPKEIAIERAMERYKRSGRYVPVFVIDEFFKDSPETFELLKKKVNGYMIVDGVTQQILEEGGEEIPQDRPYFQLDEKLEQKPKSGIEQIKLLDIRLKTLKKMVLKESDELKSKKLSIRIKTLNKMINSRIK